MSFTKTDFRQFFDEIQMIRKRKEFNETWKESLKGVGFSKADKALDEKRKQYNYLYTNIFRQYRIVPDDLYLDLDRFWSEALKEEETIPALITKKKWLKLGFKIWASDVFSSYDRCWNLYMDKTIEHAKKIGEGQLKDG